ncbi:MAG: hypothetical protein ACE5LB_04030 [Acidiferrobacterales bacterium]
MLDKIEKHDFAKHLGDRYQLQLGSADVLTLELIDVANLGPSTAQPGKREPFSILFRGPRQPALEQRIYRLEHPQMGVLDVFLVPIGQSEGGVHYEAIFS